MIRMFLVVGLNETDLKTMSIPKNSPYLQTALVFFATDRRSARKRAKKMLGFDPSFVQQIGRVNVDVSGSSFHRDCGQTREAEFHVMDCNDTEEGCFVDRRMDPAYLYEKAGFYNYVCEHVVNGENKKVLSPEQFDALGKGVFRCSGEVCEACSAKLDKIRKQVA